MSSVVCYNCGRWGHFASECYSGGRGSNGSVQCFKCGKPGHYASDCYSGGGGFVRGVECYKCGRVGHYASDCYSSRASGLSGCDSEEDEEDDEEEDEDEDEEEDEESEEEGCDDWGSGRGVCGGPVVGVKRGRGVRSKAEMGGSKARRGASSSSRGIPIEYPQLPGLGGVYVLEYPNGQVYVGKSSNVDRRVGEHLKGPFAASWGDPRLMAPETAAIPQDLEAWERNEVLHQMKKRGIVKVRGWKYTSLGLSAEEHKDAAMQIREKYDLCRLCGSASHFAEGCRLSQRRV